MVIPGGEQFKTIILKLKIIFHSRGKANSKSGRPSECGFTLIELLSVVAIIGILAAAALPKVYSVLEDARYAASIKDLSAYQTDIQLYFGQKGEIPDSWEELGYESSPRDSWGNKYVLNNHEETTKGVWRKDGPVVPINSRFDLFSPGPNGDWTSSIHTNKSSDDVIVADDGQFIGKAEDY